MREFDDLQRIEKQHAEADAIAEHDKAIAEEILQKRFKRGDWNTDDSEWQHELIYEALAIGRREGQLLGRQEGRDAVLEEQEYEKRHGQA